MKVKDKVIFTQDWDIFPHTIVKAMSKGVITRMEHEMIYVRLESIDKNLEDWNNEVHIGMDERKFENYVKVI